MFNTSKAPTIMSKVPHNNETGIDTGLTSIQVTFNTDLKRVVYGKDEKVIELSDLIRLRDSEMNLVNINVIYKSRVITVEITDDYLRMGEKYTLTVNERQKGEPGITSVEGIEMGVYEELTFYTKENYSLKPPTLLSPKERVQLLPPFTFEWTNVEVPDMYEIQISKRSDMSELVNDTPARFIDELEGNLSTAHQVNPDIMKPGQYYWRVASWYEKGAQGEQRSHWSEVRTFYIEDQREVGGVTPEDPWDTYPGTSFEPSVNYDDYTEVIESFPKNEDTNVNTNVRVITFKVIGEFKEEDVEFELNGESIDDEDDDVEVFWRLGEIVDKGSYKLVSFLLDMEEVEDTEVIN